MQKSELLRSNATEPSALLLYSTEQQHTDFSWMRKK